MSPDAYVEMARVQDAHWWFTARRDILRSRIEELGLPPHARILEVGSGTGANLDMLASYGSVVGLEMSTHALRFAHQLEVVRAGRAALVEGRCPESLESVRVKGPFDLICLFDVLEHLEADGYALRQLSMLLAPGGRIMLTVPAYQWLWSEHDVRLHHFRRYTRDSLHASLTNVGLRVAWLSHFNALLFPLAAIERILFRLLGRNSSAGELPRSLVNRGLSHIFSAERHLLGKMRLPFGLSLLAVATAGD